MVYSLGQIVDPLGTEVRFFILISVRIKKWTQTLFVRLVLLATKEIILVHKLFLVLLYLETRPSD